jgi:membrane-bound lytic murein transglycosylase B
MRLIKLLSTLCVICFAASSIAEDPKKYDGRPEVQTFIDEMVEEGFDQSELKKLFAGAVYKQSIVDAISRPAERVLTWKEYQDIFLTDLRVSRGTEFIHENRDALVRAEKEYGVPALVITSIIGVETMYGRIKGSYRVIDSLSTLAFDYPPRSKFFRQELKHFLRLSREEARDPAEPIGSYAGAMGYGQFISSSFREYAVDFDGDGIKDIWNNKQDAIGSVANYLARHGWRRNELVTLPASTPVNEGRALFNVSLKPSSTVAEMKKVGVTVDANLADETNVSPMLLNGKQGEEYWLGLQNFYAITRYNHSKLYAMAVYQLSERLKMSLLASSDY